MAGLMCRGQLWRRYTFEETSRFTVSIGDARRDSRL